MIPRRRRRCHRQTEREHPVSARRLPRAGASTRTRRGDGRDAVGRVPARASSLSRSDLQNPQPTARAV